MQHSGKQLVTATHIESQLPKPANSRKIKKKKMSLGPCLGGQADLAV